MIHRYLRMICLFPFVWLWLGGTALGCPACWAGYGPGDERFNKPLADLRIMYEKEGKAALQKIREVLKTSYDPLVLARALDYIAEMKDTDSIPLLEDILLELIKRVSFSSFGVGSPQFKTRLKVAHTLKGLGATGLADRIWKKYDRLNAERKAEVPYMLNALGDPKLTERGLEILVRCEGHQLMLGVLDVLAIGGTAQALPSLREKIEEWRQRQTEDKGSDNAFGPLKYSVWRIRAEQAVLKIEERTSD